ncbi:MAG TPA: Gfo/Idh/MocA family oxidoreductase [Luteitalea sp.]|nr:Gfo/Idh/MocA family oxidoreductase [Luteitalea sp.]
MDRRDFIRSTMLTGAAAGLGNVVPATARTRQVAPSDRLRLGFIGTGARAQELMDACAAVPGLQVVTLTDAYTGRAERSRARTGGTASIVADHRTVLDDRTVDAVFIATPDHWHKTMAVAALDAGKDVYIEKPLTYTADEGRDIIAAVQRTGRILQVGSQGVSSAQQIAAREIVRSGRLGQITLVRANYNRNSAGGAWLYPIPPDASERTVDWTRFLGSAPKRPFSLERFFRWRCYWDYSGGLATDLFVHLTTWIHYVLDVEMPTQVVAAGATHRWKGTHEVPDTIDAILTYPQGFTVTLGCTLNSTGGQEGVNIYGTKGALHLTDDDIRFTAETGGENNRWVVRSWPEALERAYYADPKNQAMETPALQPQHKVATSESWTTSGEDATVSHVRAFVAAVKSRTQPVEDARVGHHAAACAHMINQSIRENRTVRWDAAKDTVATA